MTRRFDPSDCLRPRILIARMSAIGDTILTLPVACRLRDRFPKAMLAWVVEEKSSHFVRNHAALDEVIVVPRGWFGSPRRVADLARRLRALRLDAAIDCQSITKTALACRLSGAPLRVGCKGRYGGELSPWLNNHLIRPRRRHLTDRSLELLAAVGVDFPGQNALAGAGVRWDIPRDLGAERRVGAWLARLLGPSEADRGFAVINPGATWDSKLWEFERFGELAERLGVRRGLRSVVAWGSPRERGWAERVVAASGGWALLAEPSTLHELAALLRQARIVVSPDTGPLHLAVAVGAPSVGLYGATHPEDCGPYGPPHAAVMKRFHDGGRRERRHATNAAMREISVDDALQACESVLCRTAGRFPNSPEAMAS